jgi:ankyrin repeat protein
MILTIDDIKNNINNIENLTTTDLICQSAKLNYLDGVKLALKRNADINIYDCFPLRIAIEHNNFEIVKFLVDNGADINIYYQNPLVIAFNFNRYNIIEYLLVNNADDICLNEISKDENEIKNLNLIYRKIKLNKIFNI